MPQLSKQTILRILSDLIHETVSISGRRAPGSNAGAAGESFTEDPVLRRDTSLREGVLGLDSVGILSVAGRINGFFNLHEVGIEDNLLKAAQVGDWVDLVDAALREGIRTITFRTSGSTGEPKEVAHSLSQLWQEAWWLADYFRDRRRIIATVSPKHIYGFLFTGMLSDLLDVAVVDGRTFDPHQWKHDLRTDDLIVSYPAFWRFLERSSPHFAAAAWGSSSTAPMPADLNRALRAKGLDRLVEIYGSTETAGVGYRVEPDEPFTLFPFWESEESGAEEAGEAESGLTADAAPPVTRLRRVPTQHPAGAESGAEPAADVAEYRVEVMDELEWRGPRQFLPLRRRDRAVQVAGINVFPTLIERRLRGLPEVEDAHVRLMRPSEGERLKAIIVPDEAQPIHEVDERIRTWIAANLSAPERPVAIRYLRRIPSDEMGKRVDWDMHEPGDWD